MLNIDSVYITPLPSDILWIDRLRAVVVESISNGLNVVIIAIARKMARLFEYYAETDSGLRHLLKENRTKVSVISEHAILTVLAGATETDTEVIIVDDFMVYGDTVETVSENVFYLTGIRPKVIAIGSSDKANYSPLWCDLVFPDPKSESQEERSCIIGNSAIPAFTARNSSKIISLKEPIDLEHTIFNLNITPGQYAKAAENMENWVREVFPKETVYTIRHKIPFTDDEAINVTVCISPTDKRKRNNDFNKLRFFLGNDKISIVSYSPNIWEVNELAGEKDLFIYSELNSVWKIYDSALRKTSISREEPISDIFDGMLERQFKLRLELCRVVWANYLKSFENALIFKNELERLASRIVKIDSPGLVQSTWETSETFRINKGNLEWLIGDRYLSRIYQLLEGSLRHSVPDCEIEKPGEYDIDQDPLMSDENMTRYNSDKASYSLMSPGVDTTLSLIFHNLWRNYGLIPKGGREEKLRIGETFHSLAKQLQFIYKSGDLQKNIHRWIDQRIDLGIVVPKYEYTYASLGRRIWRRYFRPGEREDVMVDVARLCVKATEEYYKDSPISLDDFAKDIVPYVSVITHHSEDQVTLDCFREGLFQKASDASEIHSDRTLALIIWTYMILLGAYSLPSPFSWKKVEVAGKDGRVVFDGSPIFNKE